MRNIFKIILVLLMSVGLLYSEPLSEEKSVDGYTVVLTSANSLVVGNNDIFIKLLKDGKEVTNAKVKIKFYMPEMPGMPYMEYKAKAKLDGDKYKALINFSMGGTWQYQLKFKTADEEVYKIRGSVNL